VEATNSEGAWDTVYCCRVYHGYRLLNGERNPAFRRATDGRLLNFKDGEPEAIEAEAAEVGAAIDRLRLPQKALLMMVPGHRVARSNCETTLARLVEALADKNHALVASVNTLIRCRDVEKLSVGGRRSMAVHEGSMRVLQPPWVGGETVVVIDDIVSTGHSMAAARELLTRAGAARVACIAIGRTAKLM
jgi:hypothetical protein